LSPPPPLHPSPPTAEAQLTTRVEELEEQLKSKIIALQRRDLTSKEIEVSTQEALGRYAACEKELEEARQTISRLQSELSDQCQLKSHELTEATALREKLKASEERTAQLENSNRDLNVLQREAEESISQLYVVAAERAKDCRELEEQLRDATKKIEELEQSRSLPSAEVVTVSQSEERRASHQALQEKHARAMLALGQLEAKLSSQASSETTPPLPAQLSQVATEELQVLREAISALQRENEEAKSRLDSEIAEKETLATRAQYLEDMLESLSSQQSSSSGADSSEEKLRSLEAEVKRSAQEILELKKDLEEARLVRPRSSAEAKAAGVHPVYDIFGLSENFETRPPSASENLLSPQKSEALNSPQQPPLEVAKSSSGEKSLKPEKSERRISRAPASHRQRSGDPKATSRSPSREEPAADPSTSKRRSISDTLQGDNANSSSSLLSSSQKSSTSKIKSSPSSSELPDPKAYKAYCKKLNGEISALKKDRHALKKDILAWNAQFEKDNGREATREEKESLASDLYDRYQYVGIPPPPTLPHPSPLAASGDLHAQEE
jgi:hypothetical protein